MKEENEITEEVRELLKSLEQHGRNVRRQKKLSDLIDNLSSGTSLRAEHRKLYPLWWIVSAAAACLLLWLLTRPTMQETPNITEEILVEETGTKDTMISQEEEVVKEEPDILEKTMEKLLAEETPIKAKQPQNKSSKPTSKAVNENLVEPQLAENTPTDIIKTENSLAEITEPHDKSNTEPTPTTIEENFLPLTSHSSSPTSPQRRVIQSLNLVCYECQKEPEYTSHLSPLTSHLENTIFGQPQDPNMKNGSLAFELKLH